MRKYYSWYFCSLIGLSLGSNIDFENVDEKLSTEELKNLIREMDYMEDELRLNPDEYYDEWALPKINTRSDEDKDYTTKHGGNKAVLPAYCDPPNPCPIGYTSNDGCIEDFENSSDYSRNFQYTQNCLCDSEHMFNCPDENIPEDKSFLASLPDIIDYASIRNPFFAGQRLPIAAKKGLPFSL
ncbi:unnamed protein product [Lepeophtheirus salmonis]|uniref:Neuroendocrine protein 7B2 n=1 Tax=Lepeophtheirus salmonis TaxID=72036 RepID=A0A7R8CVT5_LEPSM|nr:unnamed protein product [Lepeophtheirus salmonis]CAF2947622.1 unnamed protein product [Lepeophtheirus salmonis]